MGNYIPITGPLVGGFPQKPFLFLPFFDIQNVSGYVNFNPGASNKGLTPVHLLSPWYLVSWKGWRGTLADRKIGEQRDYIPVAKKCSWIPAYLKKHQWITAETLEWVAQRDGRSFIPGNILGQASKQPDLVEDVSAHCRGSWSRQPIKVACNSNYSMGFGWIQSTNPTLNDKLSSVIHVFIVPGMDCGISDSLGMEASSSLQNRAFAAAQAVQSTLDFLFTFSTMSLHGSSNQTQNLLLRPQRVLRSLTPMECLLPPDSKHEIFCSSL